MYNSYVYTYILAYPHILEKTNCSDQLQKGINGKLLKSPITVPNFLVTKNEILKLCGLLKSTASIYPCHLQVYVTFRFNVVPLSLNCMIIS